jgi:hypothetical protein
MGDHTTDTLIQVRKECDQLLREHDLHFTKDVMRWLVSDSDHIDCFVSQSRDNERVRKVFLNPFAFYGQDDGFWDKVGQAIGNLQALERLFICNHHDNHYTRDDEEVVPIPHWEILARILSHVRQKITVILHNVHLSVWHAEEIRSFARAIRGHPTITRFYSGNMSPYAYEALDALYSALATLPALKSAEISAPLDDGITLANPETLTELLRVPSLHFVCFYRFNFTRALCHATANAFMEGTAVNTLHFKECSFSTGECAAIMANGLARNTSVSYIKVERPRDVALYSVLATALLSNSTLKHLDLGQQKNDGGLHLSPLLLALGNNTGLKTMVCAFGLMDESLSTAMQNGLGMNETLEILELNGATLLNADLCCRALSFLRTNKVLKSLMVNVDNRATESSLSVFRSHIAAMLQENATLERLSIGKTCSFTLIKAEEYFVFITALQYNNTLIYLHLQGNGMLMLTRDEDKQMASLLKKNYALEDLPTMKQGGDVGAILRLNKAGRRYLVQDGSSISKGVEVLSSVNFDVNYVFLHLLENPRLCDRRAVEMAGTGGWVDGSDS